MNPWDNDPVIGSVETALPAGPMYGPPPKPEKPEKPRDPLAVRKDQLDIMKAERDLAKPDAGTEDDVKAQAKRASLDSLVDQINRVDQLYRQGFRDEAAGVLSSIGEYIPSQRKAQFNAAGAGMAEQGLAAFRVPGVGSQSDTELRQFVEANRPTAGDFDSANEEKLRQLRLRVDATRQEMGLPPAKWLQDTDDKDVTAPGGATAPEGGGDAGGPRRDPTPEQQSEFFKLLKTKGQGEASAYLASLGFEMKDPTAADRPYSEALQRVSESPLVESAVDIAGGFVQGLAALPDMAAKTVGQGLAFGADALGMDNVARGLRNPLQFGEMVEQQFPTSDQPLAGVNRFGGQMLGGVVGLPARATNALTELIVGRGNRAAGQVPSALASFAPKPANVAAAAERQGVALMPADVGGQATKALTAGTAISPLSRGPVIKLAQQGAEDLQAATSRATSEVGNVLSVDEAGEAVRRGGTEWIKQATDRASRWYSRADELAGNMKIMPPTAVKVLDDHIAEYQQAGELGADMVGELTKVRDTLAQAGGITVTGLRKARSLLGAMSRNDKLRGTDAGRIFGQVLQAASDDMQGALTQAGKGQAASMFKRADTLWRERIENIDEVLEPLIGKAKSGEDIIRNLNGMMSGRGGGIRRLQRVIDTLPADEKGDVLATIINTAGKAKPGAQNDVGDVFSSETFLTNWNTWSGKAKRAMFGNGELRQNLDDIAMITSAKRDTLKLANKSQTGVALGGNLAGLAGLGAVATPQAAAVVAALQYGTGRLMASPAYTRWLARMPKTPEGINRHIGRLPYIARSSPVLSQDIARLQSAFDQPLAVPLAAEPNEAAQTEN